uniref:Retrotransposon protein, putative, Ty3-gypsy subclass n=1 Tax=Oryza sativa subsp. japonica TaxID=39947 RepID=Q2QU80_ORYSJ|nr:retrotransposon protein, putative, Ty3-gypsy subclass [Oryza sativa Japonica Group]
MGSVSGVDDLAFPPGQAFRFSSLNFITNEFGKISLLDSDSNQSGRDQVPTPFGILNSAENYFKIISPKSALNHSDEIQSTPQRPDQDDGSYPSILMRLPNDLAAVFTAKTSPTQRSRRAPASAPIQSRSREVGVILQPLGTVLTEELDGYLSSPGVSSRPTEILDYDDFGYHHDHDDFDDSYKDSYTPLFFGVFMADNETEEQHRAREVEEERARQETERRRQEEERQRQERERLQHRYDDDVDGVAAFTNDLRRVDWPAGFKPTGIEKYDGTTNPESWLTVYGLTIRAAGGDSKAMANYLPVALADSARSWLHGLPRGTIGSWAELRDHFIANFQGTFERPGTQFDLYNVIQKSGESLRDYIRRFSEQRNKISDITDDVIIAAFTKSIRHEDLVGKFGRKPPKTVKQMFEKANEYAKAEDAITASKQSGTTWKPKKDTPAAGGSGSNNHKDRKRKPGELVATASPSSRQRSRVNTFDKIINSQCPHHPNSNHAAKDCFPNTPQYLRWSEIAIKFDCSDHPDRVVHPGRYPLVLDPVVRNVKLRRTLIDGGSALNILFAKTLDDMQIPHMELKPSNAPFHGVIPGLSATPLGQITLPVTFGTWENFRTENVCFEVAYFETAYHAILG